MSQPWTCILFDLDGTISDSAPGITASLGYMFEKLGREVPDPEELLAYVGPPILESFRVRAGMDEVESAQALAIYRQHYLEHNVHGSPIFDGIPGILKAIHRAGIPLGLATSKPEFPASVILDNANLTQYFRVLAGSSIDEIRSAKKDVVEDAMRRFTMIGVDTSRAVMVGDRLHDVEGAAAHGIPAIFVEWGYGAEEEQEGAIGVAKSPQDLHDLLLP
ncbi:HAD hydrolase-like protein [Salinibacterium sp. SYSU T00001]|uniref:HAD hydrolase-like protein n=1 Tax=Homoserinimonas sedimenticola TaxID=2986805 RepID=UPI002236C0B9|nr:HAD hydrolase-like protein [Salinibacterium sedimenticola]MCW4385838.1 HAD hydrolase-like protein [Salinibacterium sedimenticola]